jgi:magnesium transporter
MATVVNCAAYENGRRVTDLDIDNPEQMKIQPGRVIWIGLHEPTQEILKKLQRYFGLHDLAVEDAYRAHQRPKLEVYGEMLFLVMKTAQFVGDHVAMGETCFFAGRGYVISVRHGPSSGYADVRARCESAPEKLKKGEDFIVYALMDFIVDRYFPIIDHMEEMVEDLEEQVFSGKEERDTLEEIVDIRRDLLEMRHAVAPLPEMCQRLMRYDVPIIDANTHPYFRDVYDHSHIMLERIDALREMVKTVVESKMLFNAMKQNEVMKKLAAWAAMLAVPTAIAGIYGMNFKYMPELDWTFGYPATLLIIVLLCGFLYWRFRKAGWL